MVGTARIAVDDHISGPPELILEVPDVAASDDSHQRISTCCGSGVGEYIVWRTLDQPFDHFTSSATGTLDRVPLVGGLIRSVR